MAKFKARARTVDMLGRQQIAGAATAISELFKNAHDAYAERVEVDYYRPDGIFLLRDNGIGMTKEEFEDKWLTLGTESKVGGGIFPYRPAGVEERLVMGEKGIGRLAIARIGPQVLVMTRAKRDQTLHDLVVGLVNWELFEIPGLNLDEIEIPVATIPDGMLPSKDLIDKMVAELQVSIRGLSGRIAPERLARIQRNLGRFTADPARIDAFFNAGDALTPGELPLSLAGSGFGTHFLIQPADSFLAEEIDRDDARPDSEPTFTKFLVGFGNEMVPGARPPAVRTAFRDWKNPEVGSELISGSAFLTASDFEQADHHFSGRFDEFGQFVGEVKIYDKAPVRHVVAWEAGNGEPTQCGPFTINFAHLQGAARESRVPAEEHARLYSKLNRFGGLYVYRDGVRVLPYGNSDFDWLNIETRRNKGQAYYFFAYRRIFGAVEISQKDNKELVEKAGREAFQTNKAYRQFTAILENFLIQLAADFFRGTDGKAAIYNERKKEIERAELARRKREESVFERRKQFSTQLDNFFQQLERKEPESDISTLHAEIHAALNGATSESDPERAANLLIEAEGYAERGLDDLRKKYSITRPRDIGLPTTTRREWDAYQIERNRLEDELFSRVDKTTRETISAAAATARLQIDQRRRLQLLIGEMSNEIERTLKGRATDAESVAEEKYTKVKALARKALTDVKDAIVEVKADLQRANLAGLSPDAVEDLRLELERKIERATSPNREALESARQQLLEVNLETPSLGQVVISSGETTGALEEEVFALRERADADAELIQLGMALSVVNHEFDAVIRSIRNELRRFKGWANATPQLRPIYDRINGNFEHLDGYLTLFTPLQRRLYRKPQTISGADISKFLSDLFDERLKRHEVTMNATTEFRKMTVLGYPSTFLPVFVNLIDNAIYWLKDYRRPREIYLVADSDGFLVANNGPKIAARDQETIFDLRFTRKPGGRGMGLYISRMTLERAGFQISLISSPDYSVCFKISPEPAGKETTNNE